ncbi:MAG: TonB-dependent receptor [Culturomica sp.]|nr:TonB-dependent receptor [Culturomica sp.]
MKIITAILTSISCITIVYGQTKEISGFVFDKDDSTPIAGAIIQIKDSLNVTLHYTFTNYDGSFVLKYNNSHSNFIHVQSMGYQSFTTKINDVISSFVIRLTPQPTILNDVIVKAPDIEQRNDTLVYYISRYARTQDKNIADVLKRLPGIEIDNNGQIKYNGEPINKFYIDGSDFMEGRYGLATENISPSDVASVEILENHQPLQVLKGLEFSQQAGLNIKLKEEARHKWVMILNGGIGGAPLLYDASLFAMRIAGKWQSMETFRINNTGWNPASQNIRHTKDKIFGNGYRNNLWRNYISVGKLLYPLDAQRTRDNLSFLANTTNSWKVGNGYDIRMNISYESDRLDNSSGYITNYFDPNIKSFTESNNMCTKAHRLNTQLALQLNRPTLYIKDNLYIDADRNDALSHIGGTLTTTQKSEMPSFNITNDLQIVKRVNDNLLTLSSRNGYKYKPHSLSINIASMVQDIKNTDFRSTTEARYGWIINRWNVYARCGFDYNLHNIKSNLYGFETTYPTECNMDFALLNTFLSPEASFQLSKFLLTISIPINYHIYHINSKTNSEHITKNEIVTSPSIYIQNQFTAKTDMTAQVEYALTPTDAEMYINNLFMTDFRNLYMNEPILDNMQKSSATLALRYRNPITSLFANISVRLEWSHYPFMQNQLFIDDRILTTFFPLESDSRIMRINGRTAKGLMSGRMVLGFDAGYMQVSATTMRQNIASPYVIRDFFILPSIKGTFVHWLSADYKLQYNCNKMDIEQSEKSSYNLLKQYLNMTFIPDTKWLISIGGEHYYTNFNSGSSANLVLLDTSIRCNISKRVEFSLIAKNILNKREYKYATHGLLSETDYTYRIRNRSVIANVQIRL